MKPVPKARQTSAPGMRLVSGRLLNQIAEAITARTPLNAGQTTATGYSGAAQTGTAPRQGPPAKFDANRTYVVAPSLVARLKEALRARMAADGVNRTSPSQTTAAGLEALLRAIEWATPDSYAATSPEGYHLPANQEPRTARLRIEWENRQVFGDLCCIDINTTDRTYITKQTTVNVFENGSTTATVTAAGNIRTWQTDEPADCAALMYDNDFDPEFDYGAFVDSSYTEDTTPFSAVLEAAAAALAGAAATTPNTEITWPESAWKAATAPGGWTYGLGGIGTVTNYAAINGLALATTFRWRVKNTGQCHMKIFWERRLQADDSVLASDSISLGRGTTSAWQEPPAAPADPSARIYVTLSAIQLGPYR